MNFKRDAFGKIIFEMIVKIAISYETEFHLESVIRNNWG